MQLCFDDAHGHLNFKLKVPNNNNNYKHEYRKQPSACLLTILADNSIKKNQHRVRLPSGKKIPQIEFHTLLLTIYVKSVLLVHIYTLSGCWQRQRAVKSISLFSMSMCLSTKNNQRKFRVVCRAEHGIKQCYIAVGNQRHSR